MRRLDFTPLHLNTPHYTTRINELGTTEGKLKSSERVSDGESRAREEDRSDRKSNRHRSETRPPPPAAPVWHGRARRLLAGRAR